MPHDDKTTLNFSPEIIRYINCVNFGTKYLNIITVIFGVPRKSSVTQSHHIIYRENVLKSFISAYLEI